jgi:hypothetical protein
LGCWDTVGSLGVPNTIPFLSKWVNKKYQFYDCELSSTVQYALHAVSIDERRRVFDVTRMKRKDGDTQPLKEVWFPGGHGCVGGGSVQERELSDAALEWMIDQIENPIKHSDRHKLGLAFDRNKVEDGMNPDYKCKFDSNVKWFYTLLGMIDREIIPKNKDKSGTTMNWFNRILGMIDVGTTSKEVKCKDENEDINKYFDDLHESVKERWQYYLKHPPKYCPETLKPFAQKLDEWKQ